MPNTPQDSCCSLDAIVTVDDRGQILLPKELRLRAGIAPGARLAAVTYRGADGNVCCVTLTKTEALADAVTSMIGPAVRSAAPGESDER